MGSVFLYMEGLSYLSFIPILRELLEGEMTALFRDFFSLENRKSSSNKS
jgi:hypothetical protein